MLTTSCPKAPHAPCQSRIGGGEDVADVGAVVGVAVGGPVGVAVAVAVGEGVWVGVGVTVLVGVGVGVGGAIANT